MAFVGGEDGRQAGLAADEEDRIEAPLGEARGAKAGGQRAAQRKPAAEVEPRREFTGGLRAGVAVVLGAQCGADGQCIRRLQFHFNVGALIVAAVVTQLGVPWTVARIALEPAGGHGTHERGAIGSDRESAVVLGMG